MNFDMPTVASNEASDVRERPEEEFRMLCAACGERLAVEEGRGPRGTYGAVPHTPVDCIRALRRLIQRSKCDAR